MEVLLVCTDTVPDPAVNAVMFAPSVTATLEEVSGVQEEPN